MLKAKKNAKKLVKPAPEVERPAAPQVPAQATESNVAHYFDETKCCDTIKTPPVKTLVRRRPKRTTINRLTMPKQGNETTVDAAIQQCLAVAGIDLRLGRKLHAEIKSLIVAAKAETTAASPVTTEARHFGELSRDQPTLAEKSRTIVDDVMADSMDWPNEKFENAEERGKHGGLVTYLRRVWKPVLDKHNLIMPVSLLAKKDEEAAESIYNLRGRKKTLPPDLFILVETDVTAMRIAADPAGMARTLLSKRRTLARRHSI